MKIETNVNKITRLAVIASLYVVLTIVFSFISYGDIQIRISEILVLLCFFRKDYFYGLTIGCIIANLFSPYGMIDVMFGTLATVLALLCVMNSKRLFVACIYPVIFNAIIIGFEIGYLDSIPYYLPMITVGIGEAISMAIGFFVMKKLRKNKQFLKVIMSNQNNK